MVDYTEKIKEFEIELRDTPYNKRTQHSIGLLKAKIARLREKAQSRGSGGGGYSYNVRKSGDATIVLVGYPSVGKSTLLNALTNAESDTGSYAFTTLDVIPGLLEYEHAQIQVLDVPGILKGAANGKGRGKEVLSVVRNSDMVLFLVDVNHPEHFPVLQKEVADAGMRVNQQQPDVKLKKKSRGGVDIGATLRLTHMTRKTIKSILHEFRISNADLVIRTNITVDELIDVIEKNKHYVPGLTVLTKTDLAQPDQLEIVKNTIKPDICVSATTLHNIEGLKRMIFDRLNFIRIYCKEIGEKPDMGVPIIMRRPATVRSMCIKLHKDFVKNFKSAKIWGKSAKFPGQRLSLKHVLKDGDVVELHIR